jgi:Flp pilus assembly protein TadD
VILDSLLEARPDLPDALELRATVKSGIVRVGGPESLLAGAMADLERSVTLDPRRVTATSELAWSLMERGRFSDALEAYERALAYDAFQTRWNSNLRGKFDAALLSRRFALAEDACQEGRRRFPRDERFLTCELRLLAFSASSTEAADRALRLADEAVVREVNTTARAMLPLFAAQVLARAGRGADADREAVRAEHLLAHTEPQAVVLAEMAAVRLLRGDRDSARALVRRAQSSDPHILTTLRARQEFEPLRPLGAAAPPASPR